MFMIRFFVDDRKVGDALRALVGFAQGTPEVVPVTNADVGKGGKISARTNGTGASLFLDYANRRKLKVVNAALAKDFLKGIGRSPASATYILTEAVKAGSLKRTPGTKGTSTTYQVLRGRK